MADHCDCAGAAAAAGEAVVCVKERQPGTPVHTKFDQEGGHCRSPEGSSRHRMVKEACSVSTSPLRSSGAETVILITYSCLQPRTTCERWR